MGEVVSAPPALGVGIGIGIGIDPVSPPEPDLEEAEPVTAGRLGNRVDTDTDSGPDSER